ncbi:MAG: DUF2703 domain-containing protein [Candidatus Fermentibacteraceae bacterium]|nr:DUF2703 domain-containing protein [Candidatus Fermentibacteraceae bacterium]
MKELRISWQRLVNERGDTCDRCGTTEEAVEEAAARLGTSMKPLGIDVVLEKRKLSSFEFTQDPLQSNRIWIDGIPLEEWLTVETGQSRCCSACGDEDCRTVTANGVTYEAIPAELIVRAGLMAAAGLPGGAREEDFLGFLRQIGILE